MLDSHFRGVWTATVGEADKGQVTPRESASTWLKAVQVGWRFWLLHLIEVWRVVQTADGGYEGGRHYTLKTKIHIMIHCTCSKHYCGGTRYQSQHNFMRKLSFSADHAPWCRQPHFKQLQRKSPDPNLAKVCSISCSKSVQYALSRSYSLACVKTRVGSHNDSW